MEHQSIQQAVAFSVPHEKLGEDLSSCNNYRKSRNK